MLGMNGSHSLEEMLRQIEKMDKSLPHDRYFKIVDVLRPAIQEAIEEGIKRNLSGRLADFVAHRIVQVIKCYNFNERSKYPDKINFPDDGDF